MHIVSLYGEATASYRERIQRWLELSEITATRSSYTNAPHLSSKDLISRPLDVVKHELGLRNLTAEMPQPLLMHREASPFSRGGLETSLLKAASYSIYDFDDALYDDWGSGNALRSLFPKAIKIRRCLPAADVVIAGNPTLANWASDLSSMVTMIPTCVDLDDYRRKSAYGLSDPPLIGWIGSLSTEQHLMQVLPALDELFSKLTFTLEIVSGPKTNPVLDGRRYVRRVPWSRGSTKLLSSWDVGIMPLPDSSYERGKCGYKLLQYAASGLPGVGTPVGINRDILAGCGFGAASTSDQWVDAILSVLEASTREREEQGNRAVRFVAEGYTHDVWLPAWKQAAGV